MKFVFQIDFLLIRYFFTEIELSFPYRDVIIKRDIDPKDEYSLEEEIGR